MSDDPTPEPDAFVYLGIFAGFLLAIFAMSMVCGSQPQQPSNGYGGSPGHMSPMEVEELYKKNQKP